MKPACAEPSAGIATPCDPFTDRMPPIACFVGISFWKRRRVADFNGGTAQFASSAAEAVAIAVRSGGAIAAWPSRMPPDLPGLAKAAGIQVCRIEDGFIRSRGLGADFIPPASVIIDRRGIYYDPRQPSDLEALLAGHAFPPALLMRAGRLIDMLLSQRITKYNLGGQHSIAFPPGRKRLLVAGQVSDDQSVQAGGMGIAPGLLLLDAVRGRNPDAFITYKPHPDVEAGHRHGAIADVALLQRADSIARDVDTDWLIASVDEVHTVTSLIGFEALLRRRTVVTYGRPFYAGWGLTTDLFPHPGRTRWLTLEQLVAATLILYPHYIDPVTRLPCGPEQLIARMQCAADWRVGVTTRLRQAQGALRRGFARHAWGAA